MFSKFDGVKLSSQLTIVLSSNVELDVNQLELWHKNIMSLVEVLWSLLKYLFSILDIILLDTEVLTNSQVIGTASCDVYCSYFSLVVYC